LEVIDTAVAPHGVDVFFTQKGYGSFEQITLHTQLGVLGLQLGQPGPFYAGQAFLFAAVDAVLADPVPQGGVVDARSLAIWAIGLPDVRTSSTASRLNSAVNLPRLRLLSPTRYLSSEMSYLWEVQNLDHAGVQIPAGWELLPRRDAFLTCTVKEWGSYWLAWQPRSPATASQASYRHTRSAANI
jgi:hypothetical protein